MKHDSFGDRIEFGKVGDDLQSLRRAVAAGLFLWADENFGNNEWEAVGIAEFHGDDDNGCAILRQAVLTHGKILEIGDDVDDTLSQYVPLGNLDHCFTQRNSSRENNWRNYKLIVWANGRAEEFFSYEPFSDDDPRQWSDESEFTFGPFEEEPVLRE